MNIIIVNNEVVKFENNSLSVHVARKMVKALTHAYMRALSITCAPYTPTQPSDRAWYISACQLVHDNLWQVEEGETIRNECIEKLRA